jgi:glycosidase
MRTRVVTTLAAAAALLAPAARAGAQAAAPARAAVRPAPGAPVAHPAWSRNATIYEVNVRQYTPEGTFAALQQHLPRLKALGVDILWLMPVQPIGRKNRKGPLGSYYSIADYRAVNPEFGTAADARRFVDAAHRQGMKVVLDWVPNHTAYDHPWTAQHPDWYERTADGGIHNARDNEGKATDWTDVAELDYGNAAMRRAMLADMRYWLDTMRVDGFRCDVAGGVPDDFWADARRQLGAGRPGLFMLAEAETPGAHAAFDMTYGWELHHLLNDVSKGKKGAARAGRVLRQAGQPVPGRTRTGCTSPATTTRTVGTAPSSSAWARNHLPSFVLAATAAAECRSCTPGRRRASTSACASSSATRWTGGGPSLAGFYRAAFDLKHTQPALGNGAGAGRRCALATDGGARVYAYTRTRGANTVLVALNYGDAPAAVSYTGLARPGAYRDWFGRTRVSLGASGRLEIPAHGYRVLVR